MLPRLDTAIRAQRYPLTVIALTLAGAYVAGSIVFRPMTVPAAVVVLGVIAGLAYGLLAVGLVLVYRTSGVLNFAHGEVGTLAGSLFGVWVAARGAGGFGLPYWLMLPAAMVVAALASMAVEVVAVRRVRSSPRVISLVMTLGAAQFFLLVSLAVNTKIRNGSLYPRPPGFPSFNVGVLAIPPEYTALLALTPIFVIALAIFLNRSRFGIAMRASADNRDAALTSAIPVNRMSSLAWALAGMASAFVAILQFPQKGFVISGAALGPSLLVRALLAAVVARMVSLPIALAFGVVIGVIEHVTLWNSSSPGTTEVVLFCILLVVLLLQRNEGTRSRSTRENWANVRSRGWVPPEWRTLPRVRRTTAAAVAVAAAGFVALGLTSNRSSAAFILVVAYAMVGLSVYVVTGMSGQLSLGQFAVAGIGAVVSVRLVSETGVSIGVGIFAAGAVGAAVSGLIGLPALRLRGMMLAVITLSFAVAAQAWLLSQPWALGSGVRPPPLGIGDGTPTARTYFLFSLPFLATALWLVRNISRGGYGRMLRGLRDNEDGARAFGVTATRRKLEAFGFAGFLAGTGGAVFAHGLPWLTSDSFAATNSITVVAVTLIGGLSLMIAPILGALYLLALPTLVELDAAGLAASTFGWLVLLLYFPGGLAQAIQPMATKVLALVAGTKLATSQGQAGDVVQQMQAAVATRGAPALREAVSPGNPAVLLEVRDLSKRFGGLTAVDGVSMIVAAGETVGIIGPNGAGKTTLFELISGFTRPDAGAVVLDGRDVTGLAPERRARLGLLRSFQDARLFPTLTVRETLELAADSLSPTKLWTSLVVWPSASRGQRAKSQLADDLIEMMGLTTYAGTTIGELSTGTRRIADLAAIVALGPRLVLLDEPSSGVAQRETEALGELLTRLKAHLSTTFVVIEHDMPLLLGISDRVIAMETGRVIAQGRPSEVINHPEVVASYLGDDRLAVARSGPRPLVPGIPVVSTSGYAVSIANEAGTTP